MCTFKGKPFPLSLYGEYSFKPFHFMVFWTLYNDLCIGDEYWVYYTRSELGKLVKESNPEIRLSNISSVLQSLADRDYIQIRVLQDRSYGTGIQAYEIKIHPDAWEKKEPVVVQRGRSLEQQLIWKEKRRLKYYASKKSQHPQIDPCS
jgi:hypothetical protein